MSTKTKLFSSIFSSWVKSSSFSTKINCFHNWKIKCTSQEAVVFASVCVPVCMFWKISTLDCTVLVVSCFATSLVLLSATDLQVTHVHNEQWHHTSTCFPATKIAWAECAGRVADGSLGKQNTYTMEAVIRSNYKWNPPKKERKEKKIEATWDFPHVCI